MNQFSDDASGDSGAPKGPVFEPSTRWGIPEVIKSMDEKWQARRPKRRWSNERYRMSLVLRKNLFPDQEILDVGCGTGYYVPDYLERVGPQKVHLADGSAEMLANCRDRFPSIPEQNFYQTSIFELPFPEGRFDAVINCDVLMHIPDYRKALRELFRVCNPRGGRLFLRVNLIDGPTDGCLPSEANPDPSFIYWIAYGRDEFRKTLEDLNPTAITLVDRICRKSIKRPDKEVIGQAAIVVLTRGDNPRPIRTGTRLTHLLKKPLGAWT